MQSLQKKIAGSEITFFHNEQKLLFNPFFLRKQMDDSVNICKRRFFVVADFNDLLERFNNKMKELKNQEVITKASFFEKNVLCSFSLRKIKTLRFSAFFVTSLKEKELSFEHFKILDCGVFADQLISQLFKITGKKLHDAKNGDVFLFVNHLNQYLLIKKDPDSFIWIGNGNFLDGNP